MGPIVLAAVPAQAAASVTYHVLDFEQVANHNINGSPRANDIVITHLRPSLARGAVIFPFIRHAVIPLSGVPSSHPALPAFGVNLRVYSGLSGCFSAIQFLMC